MDLRLSLNSHERGLWWDGTNSVFGFPQPSNVVMQKLTHLAAFIYGLLFTISRQVKASSSQQKVIVACGIDGTHANDRTEGPHRCITDWNEVQ